MEPHRLWFIAVLKTCFVVNATAAVLYVNVNSTEPTPPFNGWPTAATNIQDAIDAASAGDQILVTNGIYQSGGRVVYGVLTNRVAITKPITVQSVNGAAVTIIRGIQVPDQSGMNTNGYKSVRCAYLTNNAVLSGFTLTNGGTWTVAFDSRDKSGAGTWCESNALVSNCLITSNVAYISGGGVYQGQYTNCTIVSNTVFITGGGAFDSTLDNCTLSVNQQIHPNIGGGGGAYLSVLNNCTLSGNSSAANDSQSSGGGGVLACMLTNCTLTGNSATFDGGGANVSTLSRCSLSNNVAGNWGGGAYGGILISCTISGNSANAGGGVVYGSLNNCRLIQNMSPNSAGGAGSANLVNCLLYGNSGYVGGGAHGGTLDNCTVCSNSAVRGGGGVSSAAVTNSIVYFNSAAFNTNYDSSSMEYCCTWPKPTNGIGNIANDPMFVDLSNGNLRLQSNSPCINSGSNADAPPGPDLDGNPRIVGGTVDIGAYEFQYPTSVISYAWLEQYGFPIDGSADYADPDSDGMNNWQEWIARTDPTNAASVLKMLAPSNSPSGVSVSWLSVPDRNYAVFRSTNLPTFAPLAINIPGQTNTTGYLDTNAVGAGRFFYRVGVLP
jgi:hypothetical protein